MRLKLGMLAATGLVALSIGGAGAADLSAYRAPPPPPPLLASSWTGLYIGANVGYGWGQHTPMSLYSGNFDAFN